MKWKWILFLLWGGFFQTKESYTCGYGDYCDSSGWYGLYQTAGYYPYQLGSNLNSLYGYYYTSPSYQNYGSSCGTIYGQCQSPWNSAGFGGYQGYNSYGPDSNYFGNYPTYGNSDSRYSGYGNSCGYGSCGGYSPCGGYSSCGGYSPCGGASSCGGGGYYGGGSYPSYPTFNITININLYPYYPYAYTQPYSNYSNNYPQYSSYGQNPLSPTPYTPWGTGNCGGAVACGGNSGGVIGTPFRRYEDLDRNRGNVPRGLKVHGPV